MLKKKISVVQWKEGRIYRNYRHVPQCKRRKDILDRAVPELRSKAQAEMWPTGGPRRERLEEQAGERGHSRKTRQSKQKHKDSEQNGNLHDKLFAQVQNEERWGPKPASKLGLSVYEQV